MTYEEWLQSVPSEITADPLWQMRVYRLALFAADLGWYDVSVLAEDARMRSLADQLYRALGSIAANIAEGYSRRSGKERARFYEYALGSAREARTWYIRGIITSKTRFSSIGYACSPRLSACSYPSFPRSGKSPVSSNCVKIACLISIPLPARTPNFPHS